MSRRIFGFGKRLARDERGAVLIYVSIAMTVFMGFAALIIDGGRLFTLDTEMQSGADAIALAGAAELDGNADAEIRAQAAMDNLVQNSQTFGTGAAAITLFTPRFLSELPDDDQPLSDATVSPDPASSRFVEVTVTDRAMDSMFATAIGGTATPDAGAVAVAGFTSAVCKFTPLFICNPYEGSTTTTLDDALQDPAQRRRLIELKKGPGGGESAYFPGNFGFLEPNAGPGANELRESLAKVDPGSCFRQDGVEMQTGSIQSVRQAVNTRFDVYEGSFNSKKNNSDYRPARDVTKGYTAPASVCNADVDPVNAMPLPTDDCSRTDGDFQCESLGGEPERLGNGLWDFDGYWDMNHGDRNGIADDSAPNGWSNSSLPTRFEVYRYEIDNSQIPDQSTSGGEDGNPQCYNGGVDPNDDPDRRFLYAAVINCDELDIRGSSNGAVPAVAFLKMFITKPMTKIPGMADEDGSLFVEMIDVVKPGIDDEVVHDIVQLYR